MARIKRILSSVGRLELTVTRQGRHRAKWPRTSKEPNPKGRLISILASDKPPDHKKFVEYVGPDRRSRFREGGLDLTLDAPVAVLGQVGSDYCRSSSGGIGRWKVRLNTLLAAQYPHIP
jgi:hypothetical protein